ncbi:hypothetical protein OYT1_ch1152 [Ferriphaselus amnicola]|uniref:DUF4398 domain-containing protein n=1 Tax=Ferriphaselus amnicola TaxID=1188319 RepID=A0A2Z6GBF4_9PROT|nr:DUF4398 domain-containing protein [Ferriphaselus amnicola]BBE50712.1 hypothetical protein OYT1_ch1152 [Ferriphaselus amnicola]
MKNLYYLRSYQMMKRLSLPVAAVALVAGCASSPPAPTEQMIVSRMAVSNAISIGGNEYAPVQTKSAVDKLEGAERAATEKNYGLARQLAEQAQVDAQLAASTARAAKAQKAADALREDNRVLRQEIERKTQ